VIAVENYRLVQKRLSGGESPQTRKDAYPVPQGIEACNNGRSILILMVVKEHHFAFHQVCPVPRTLGIAFALPRAE
jgi:hypothetical protein